MCGGTHVLCGLMSINLEHFILRVLARVVSNNFILEPSSK